jgi:hypothetical protein
VLLPSANHTQTAYADFVFALDYLSVNARLLRILHQSMSARGLSCLLVNRANVQRILDEVQRGRWRPIVYLDLCCRPADPFEKLLHAATSAGSHALANPRLRDWTLKNFSHPRLESAGLPVPRTVILKPDEPDRDLTRDERAQIGDYCVIKPSYGVAGLGAVIGAPPTRDAIAKARDYDRKDDWLVQQMITWRRYEERPAYLRAYNVLGHRTLMWWSNEKGYANLTWHDLKKYDLLGAFDLIDQLAALTQLEFFSTEIAIVADSGPPSARYRLIDYVNDQCDIDPEAQPNRSPPESWITWVCQRLAEFTWRKKHALPSQSAGTIYLAD